MAKWGLRFAILIAVVAGVWLLKSTVFAKAPIEVRVQTVAAGQVEATITNTRAGTVKARRRAKLSPEVGGQVLALPYREGDSVRAGEILLELDASSQRAGLVLRRRELDAARAEEHRACVVAERAERELSRAERLAEDQILSVDFLDAAQSARDTAAAACSAASAQTSRASAAVALAQTELDKTFLRAPFDGIIAELNVEVGEWTTPSPPAMPIPAVLDVIDPSSIYVSAPMDEVDSARVAIGQLVRITVDSHRGRELAGSIGRVAPYVLDIQEQNRTVEVEAEFDDPEFASRLLPGTSADLEVILETRSEVLRIPTSALIEGNKAMVLEDGALRERDLEVGIRNWNFTEVKSGLSKGEEVVVALDQAGIEDGARAVAASEDA